MNEEAPADLLGHRLLADRVAAAEAELLALSGNPAQLPDGLAGHHWLAGGLGSSEAHARAFVCLVNRFSRASASFVFPTEAPASQRRGQGDGWLYFSQGYSHNAVAATRHWAAASDTVRVLVTASTPASLEQAGHVERAGQLRRLLESGVKLVPMPGRDEYTILIRTIGPLCGFLVAIRLAVAAGAQMDIPGTDRLTSMCNAARDVWSASREALLDEWINGAGLNTIGPIASCIQNLTLKRLEGIYRDSSLSRDLLGYAHGTFQREVLCQRPQWVLCDAGHARHPIVERFLAMNASSGIPARVLASPGGFPEDLFFYEMLFNRILQDAVIKLGIDQVNWPGRGADGPLYNWDAGL
jgi:creatinine amidohydrolase